MTKKFLMLFGWVLASSCGSDSHNTVAEDTLDNQPQNSACPAPEFTVSSIATLVEHINKLEKPLNMDCLLMSLPHPLQVQATTSVISAQPAMSRERPRIFILSGNVYLSIVPGEEFLELGEIWESKYSVKGELKFPVTEELTATAPFVNVGPVFSGQTRCGGPCHGETKEYANMGGVTIFASQIIRPNPQQLVPVEELKESWLHCQDKSDIACKDFEALFQQAQPVPFEFAEDLPYF